MIEYVVLVETVITKMSNNDERGGIVSVMSLRQICKIRNKNNTERSFKVCIYLQDSLNKKY